MPRFVVNLSLPLRKLVAGESAVALTAVLFLTLSTPCLQLPPARPRPKILTLLERIWKCKNCSSLPSVLEIFKHTGTLKDIDDEPETPTT